MGVEIPIGELAQEVPEEIIGHTYDILVHRGDIGPFFITKMRDSLSGYGVIGDGQAHVVEAVAQAAQGRTLDMNAVRTRIAQTIDYMQIIRGHYQPDTPGLRIPKENNPHNLQVEGAPIIELAISPPNHQLPVRLQVESHVYARLANSPDGSVDYPVETSGTRNYWSFREAFPRPYENIQHRLSDVVIVGTADAPNQHVIHELAERYDQHTINMLLTTSGVSLETLPKVPEDTALQIQSRLAQSFARRLISLETGVAEANRGPMPLDAARLVLSVLAGGAPDNKQFVGEVKELIEGELKSTSQKLSEGVPTLDEGFALMRQKKSIAKLLTEQFGRNGMFEALFPM